MTVLQSVEDSNPLLLLQQRVRLVIRNLKKLLSDAYHRPARSLNTEPQFTEAGVFNLLVRKQLRVVLGHVAVQPTNELDLRSHFA
jgi:hypothetical protein